ncbi:MAG TPA: methyltransferase domain-containing protein [Intrasporangium sp.]|nr:methyltransferase domain-containing protein [Intrasporangium sp.]
MSTDAVLPEPVPEHLFTPDATSAEQVRAMLTILDLQESLPAVQRLRDWTLDALAPGPGDVAVDVGSGSGTETRRLASLVGERGQAIGVEPNAPLRAEAERRAHNELSTARFVAGEALALPLDDGSVDVLRCERVLQHLPDPERAVAEFARVLAPGGRVGVVDSDWGSAIVRPEGDSRTMAAYREAALSRIRNPHSGRNLPSLLRAAGLMVDSDVGSSAIVLQGEAVLRAGFIRENAHLAVEHGLLPRDQADQLVDSIRAAAEAGEAFFAVTMFAVIGRRLD